MAIDLDSVAIMAIVYFFCASIQALVDVAWMVKHWNDE